jgi:hypothetical protein
MDTLTEGQEDTSLQPELLLADLPTAEEISEDLEISRWSGSESDRWRIHRG